ncbi:molybdopterin molybdotransferase MoeA [Desulfopila sp. IMCC35006]|uniref:molybdopterin molybdotransferase MoeA n=1 Tax=Desulfopila sp. IMCC35006 TaxID=2569542 RepID=UPI0010ABAF84|nr:molybdopterin molybdotransferase MoeA [Desulfopila sp. IMCC35006]TKB23981.1 molybdopterin molybdotransferase MoeA [Desulfopila sp. IMCC35006]
MNGNEKNSLSFRQAKQAILATIHPLPSQIVGLNEGQKRITSSDVPAIISLPSYDESTRDGFVIRVIGGCGQKIDQYQVVHEIPAGKPCGGMILPGTACRIMTGGCVPEGGTRVVPFEDCVEQDGFVCVPGRLLQTRTTFIRKIGSEITQGESLVAAGEALQSGHLALLASCGIQAVSVSCRPVVGYVCTGSELISGTEELASGQKVSSNSFLLRGLIASAGGCPEDMGIIRDNAQDLFELFAKVAADTHLDAMITTGGMGPGKYDLVERAFVEAGGKVIFNAIAMRPGKSFLFGILGRTLCFGLPGPPHAVRTLLNELIGPALYAMQGVTDIWPKKVQAHLQHAISMKRNDVLHLKDGMLTVAAGRCFVRFAERLEMGNCFIVLPPGQTHHPEGDLVEVHLALDQCAGLREG